MSLVRRGRPSYLVNRQKKKKSSAKKQPVWDDSLTDLTAYRANADELEYRKAVHQSKHLPSVRFQKEKKAAQNEEIISTLGKLNPKQLAIMKEILYNQDDLQTVLNYSDRLMNNVKDVCGDNPKRYQAFPSVTSAPGSDAETVFRSTLPSELPEYQSRLDLLSNRVMSSAALNDEQLNQDEGSSSTSTSTYTSQIDMERFRRLLIAEEENLKNACATPKQSDIFAKIRDDCEYDLIEESTATPDTSLFGAPTSAANDTKKVNRVRKIVAEDLIPSATQVVLDGTVPAGLSLSDLKKVLDELQSEMILYEQNTGKMAAEKEHRDTFSGYTMALLSSVIKLSRYLRETEEKLQTEKKNRELLSAEVSDLKIIVDALTSDLIQTQETYQNLKSELCNYRQVTDQEICLLKKQARLPLSNCSEKGNRLPSPPSLPTPPPPSLPTPAATVHSRSQPFIPIPTAPVHRMPIPLITGSASTATTDAYEMEAENMIRKTKCLEPEIPLQNSGLILSKQIEPYLPVFQPAFQLSPPVQKTRVFTQNGPGRQQSLVGIEDLALSAPSHICQPAESQNIPFIQASIQKGIPKQQNVASIVIPKPVLLGQSHNLSAPVPNVKDPGTAVCQVDNVEHHSESTEDFANAADPDPGNGEMSRSFMLSQIEELNNQHQEAEKLLRMLLQSDTQLGISVSPELALEETLPQQVPIEQPQLVQQDNVPSVLTASSCSTSPIPNFPQDHATTNQQSPEFSIAV